MSSRSGELARSRAARAGGRLRRGAVGLGVGYAIGLVLYAAARPRTADVTGLLELANNFAPWWYAPVPVILAVSLGLRSGTLAVGGLASAAAFVATWWPLFTPLPNPAWAEGASLTVMTLNVLADNPKHGELAVAIRAEDPDLVALQELEPDAAADLVRVLADRYPHHALVPEEKRGAGVLSKFPLREAEPLHLVEEGNWGQRLVVETPFGPITHFNVHPKVPRLVHSTAGFGPLRLPIDYDSRLRSTEVQRLTELLDQTSGSVLMTGDFNLSEYSRDYRLLRERLEDGYRGGGRGFGLTFPRLGSFPKALPAPWPVVRLDYIWHSADLEPVAAWVGPSGGSDHHSVVVRFKQAGGR